MTKDTIRNIVLDCIVEQQSDVQINANRDDLVYMLGYNDGVIEVMERLIDELEIEERTGEL